ncbi:pancreatic triacylglycerol lipase [Brachionus plicatilis]|uniref:Pancreatic triacylglycerol lipase n=1 Tax=Brachionus plicatilis TaxID=10195 RepID=A0A3M7RM29_BRAPC|nr:pancreatic triacylglycerol lipase [Brachionus plicatilis]
MKKIQISATRVDQKNSENTVRFHIFNPIKNSIDLVKEKNFNIAKICDPKTRFRYKFIVHGFAETWNMTFRWDWVKDMIEEMLISEESKTLCIIAVDWAELARGGTLIMNYWKAIDNMKIASVIMSNYLKKMDLNEKNFHCIGFSLGAHMCSIFYKTYFDMFKIRPGRITGLDPAGPFFASKKNNEKLHFTDADLVDIVHTSDEFGLSEKNGHMDFYPDLGDVNACNEVKQRFDNLENVILYEEANSKDDEFEDVNLTSIDAKDTFSVDNLKSKMISIFGKIKDFFDKKPKRIFISVHQFFGCSHLMAVRYFIYSINECDYRAHLCSRKEDFTTKKCLDAKRKPDFARMGYHADKSNAKFLTSFGNFYLATSSKPPYCDPKENYKPGFWERLWNRIKG